MTSRFECSHNASGPNRSIVVVCRSPELHTKVDAAALATEGRARSLHYRWNSEPRSETRSPLWHTGGGGGAVPAALQARAEVRARAGNDETAQRP